MPWAATGSLVVPEEPEPGDLIVGVNRIMEQFAEQDVLWHRARWRGKVQNGVGILFCVAPVLKDDPTSL